MTDDTSFAKLVTLACHDLRTPLATVHGFVKTLSRITELEPPADRYVEIIGEASEQMAALLDGLSLAARIEGGRYDPVFRDVDTIELARSARERLGEDRVRVGGEGVTISTDAAAADSAVAALVRCALRHGGLEEVTVAVRGSEIDVTPVTAASARVVLGEDLRDLGAAVAVRAIAALGGSVSLDGETLTISFS